MQEWIDSVMPLAQSVPLELFVLIGTFLEELLSPIPSFLVLLPAGIIAALKGMPLWYIGVLALVASLGRTVAAYILFRLAWHIPLKTTLKIGRFFGLKREHIDLATKHIGHSAKGWWTLFTLHALPIFPGLALTIGAGIIRMDTWQFLTATYLGPIINSLTLLLAGYFGIEIITVLQTFEYAQQIILAICAAAFIIWLIYFYTKKKRKKAANRVDKK